MKKLIVLILMFIFSSALNASERLRDPAQLVGFWKLNNNTADYTGNNSAGTWVNTANYTLGFRNRMAADFDGTNYITLGESLIPAGDFTISLFMETSDTDGDMLTQYVSGQTGRFLLRRTSGSLNVFLTSSICSYAVDDNELIHLVATKTGSLVKMYINNEVVATGSATDDVMNDTTVIASGGVNSYAGSIFDLKIYKFGGTAAEVEKLYKETQQRLLFTADHGDSSLILYLPDGTKDFGTNTVTLSNTDTVAGNGMEFNGDTSVIDCGDLGSVNEFTFSAWVYPETYGEANLGRILDRDDFRIYIQGSSDVYAFYLSSSIQSTSTVKLNQWTHLYITRDSDSLVSLYINGVLEATATITQVGQNNYYIGNRAAGDRCFDGKIKDLRLYKTNKGASFGENIYLDTRAAF